jgi:hypothetical protein
MQKIHLILALIFGISFSLLAQSVPQGMNYQAVARDNSGVVIADQMINLEVTLLNQIVGERQIKSYSEIHWVKTNKLGLFTLTIGQGEPSLGDFWRVPWSTADIWMEISIKGPDSDRFISISNSKILSVPYAFHAATASELVGAHDDIRRGGPGVPSQNWSLFGNSNSDPTKDKLGTTDLADLVLVTNNLERMRILADGNIDILRSLTVGENLTVKGNVYLNTEYGETVNNGPFTVAKISPTLLTGSLTVSNNSPTLLTGSLTVSDQSPTLLSGILTVDLATTLNSSLDVWGPTNLHSSLDVLHRSPTILTGSLRTDGEATFNEKVKMTSIYDSPSTSQGDLVVSGGVGIGMRLNVGGDAKFEGKVTIDGPLNLTDPTESTSTTSGALTVAGGVGIAKRLNVGGQVNITANPGGGSESVFADYPLQVQGSNQGLAIKVNSSSNGANNFVSFWDNGGMVGRIEGQNATDLLTEPEWIVEQAFWVANAVLGAGDLALAVADVAIAVAEVVVAAGGVAAASSSSTGCAGLGACVTAPIPSLIADAIVELALAVANGVVAAANLVLVIANGIVMLAEKGTYEGFRFAQLGVTYQSAAGDYAEWLPRANNLEIFFPGDIVGIKGGKISKNTDGAEYVMVISNKPIVLGNMPEEGREIEYERVAFMGQVPVKVFGNVYEGDYILPSGNHNGTGIGVSPENMTPEDYQKIVGIAWSSIDSKLTGYVNVAVGLNANDVTKLVIEQKQKMIIQENSIQELQFQVAQLSDLLLDLASGVDADQIAEKLQLLYQPTDEVVNVEENITVDRKVVFFEVTRDQIIMSLDLAKRQLMDNGVEIAEHPFFNAIENDPAYKEKIIDEMKTMVDNAAVKQSELDIQSGDLVEFNYEPVRMVSDKGLQRIYAHLGYEAAQAKLESHGVNTAEHPFFKKINEDPQGQEKLFIQLQHMLENSQEQ